MKIWHIAVAGAAVVATLTVLLVVLAWPAGGIEGRLEIGQSFGGLSSDGMVQMQVIKWLVTDDTVYTLEFMPGCKLSGVEDSPDGSPVSINGNWIRLRPGVYRAGGETESGGLLSGRHGDRDAKRMRVTHLTYVRP